MSEHVAMVDPELLQKLDRAEPDQSVEAVLSLWPAPEEGEHPSSGRQAEVERLLDRVRQAEPAGLHDFHVFPSTGQFLVRATGSFVRRLTQQSEIATAFPNREAHLIRPVALRPSDDRPGSDD